MTEGPADSAGGRLVPLPRPVIADSDGGTALADMASLRWLARRVLGQDAAELSGKVPTPSLVRAQLEREPPAAREAVRSYLLYWIRHAEAGGNFEARTRWLRWLPGSTLVRALFALGYDGIVYRRGEAIVGHVFFQRHRNALHGFSTAVDQALEGDGHSVVMILDYLAYGAQLPGITRARVGTGKNNATRRLLARIKKHERSLGWQVGDDGWVVFSP